MSTRKIEFVQGEYFHIFSRGVDKRDIFLDHYDLARFFQSMNEFNTIEPIGSIYENSFRQDKKQLGSVAAKSDDLKKIVDIICFCLNLNHYHLILTPLVDGGIEKFMHKLGSGYVHYFNNKYKRSGSLFQGPFKAVHIDSNEYLLYVSAYVNLNDKIHKLGSDAAKLSKSSWGEYIGEKSENFCKKDVILDQFKNKKEYKEFAGGALKVIRENKDMKKLLFD